MTFAKCHAIKFKFIQVQVYFVSISHSTIEKYKIETYYNLQVNGDVDAIKERKACA